MASSAWAQALTPTFGLNPNFGTLSLGEVELQLAATGGAGSGTYTWSVVPGLGTGLPPGVSLRTDIAAWPAYFGPNTSASLLGVATTPGLYTFTLRVTSGGQSVDQNATLRITALEIAETWQLPRGYVDAPYSYQLTGLDGTGPLTWTRSSGTLPPGVILSTTGLLSGTPTASGFYNPLLRLSDGTDTIFRHVSIEVHAVEITTPVVLPNATLGVPYSTTVRASGGTPPYQFNVSSLAFGEDVPLGLVLDPSGTISGTSTAGRGPGGFTVTATDANGVSTWKRMSIDTINSPQPAPRIQPYSSLFDDCTIGWPCERGVSLFAGGTAPFTWTISGQPPGMEIASRHYTWARDLNIGGTPTRLGTFAVEVTVTDALGISTTNVFPLRVSPLLQRYDDFRRTDLIDGRLDVPYSKGVTLTGGTPPYSVSVVESRLPAGLVFDSARFELRGTPTESGRDFFVLFEFTDSAGNELRLFDYFSIDGTSATGTIDITTAANLGTITPGSSLSRTLLACCAPSYVWSAIDPLAPGLSLSPDGVLSGTATTEGVYSFLIQAADAMFPAANFAQQRFTLTVAAAAPTLPITTVSLPHANVDSPYSVMLTTTGTVGTPTWTLRPRNYLPPGLTLAPDGTLSGTPTATGQFGFTVDVTDGTLSGSRFFTLFVYAAGAAPPLDLPLGPNLGPFVIGQLTLGLSATGGVAPYVYKPTPGATVIPGMRVQDGQPLPVGVTGTGAYLGVITEPGTYSTSIRVTDSLGATFDRAIWFTVTPLQILSQSPLPRAAVGTPYSFTLEPYGGTGPYLWSATNLPPGLSLSSSGQVLGTTTTAGTYFPRFTLMDLATSSSMTFTYTLFVDPFAITTSGDLTHGTVGTFYSQTLLAPGCANCTWAVVGVLPAGLTLSADVISGTPTAATASASFTVQAIGTNGTARKLFRIQIASATPQPLSIVTGSALGDRTVGLGAVVALLAQGGTLPYTWSFEAGTLPPGVSLQGPGETLGADLLPGVTYLCCRAMEVGVFDFTLRVTDGVGATVTRAFTLNGSPMRFGYFSLPIAGNPLTYDVAYIQPLLGLGGTGVYTDWTAITAMPTGLALDPATGIVSGQPGNTGVFSVRIRVTDDAGSSFTSNVTFTISGPTDTTINFGLAANLGTDQQGASSRNLLLSGGTPPYMVEALPALPPGFALLSGDSLLSGAPSGSWFLAGAPLATGTFSFTLRATDSVGNVGARTFTLSVAPFSRLNLTTLADGSVGSPYSQTLVTFTSGGAVNWSVGPTSALPPDLSLSSAGVISGTPTRAGNYAFVLDSTHSSGPVRSVTFTLLVSNLAIADAQILPPATTGVPYTHTFTATGSGSVLIWSATGLPAGLTMSPDGTMSGTATATSGTSSVVVTVTDGLRPLTRRFTLFVGAPNPLVLSFNTISTNLADVTVGQLFSTTITPFGGVPPYGWTLAPDSMFPPGLDLISGSLLPPNFTPGSTLLAGVPTTAGTYVFDLIATDSAGTQLRRTFTLRVSPISILSGTPRAATIDVPYSQQFTAVGGASPYTFSMSPTSATQEMLPPGLTLSLNGLISGTPKSTGSYAFRLRVQDGAGNVFSRTYTFTVTNALGLFVTSVNIADTSVGTARTQTLSVAGSTPSTYKWSHAGGTLPPGMDLITGGTLPVDATALAGRPTTPGVHVYTLRATDAADPANYADHIFTLRVVPMQIVSPPTEFGLSDLPAAHVGVLYSATVGVAGGTPPYTVSASPLTPLPVGLTLSPAGVLSGMPQQIGSYTLALVVSDSAGNTFASSNLTLVVTAAGTPAPLIASGVTVLRAASLGGPYSDVLNRLIRGGMPPYAWSMDAPSSLPPGLEILPGGNGVSDLLGGVPITVGIHTFSLSVADSTGQSLTLPLSLTVTTLVLIPDALPNGVVGAPYGLPGLAGMPPSVSLAPSGGTPPYVIALNAASDLPPGLTLSAAGSLSGIPTQAGNFSVRVDVTDAVGSSFTKVYRVTIDNAAGQAPAVSLSPKPIQVYHVQGAPAPSPVGVSVGTTSGEFPFSLSLAGIPGATLSATAGTAPGLVNLDLGVASLAVGTYRGFLGVDAPNAVNRFDFVPVSVTVATPPPCAYNLIPTTGSVPAAGGGRAFFVSTDSHCSWTATPSDASWITITAGASRTGAGSVRYSISPNGGPDPRSGNITVNGQVYGITQFGASCSFAINPVSLIVPAAGGLANIRVTPSAAGCLWSASSLDLVVTPSSGTSGSVLFDVVASVPPNTTAAPRQLFATIAGQTFTVNQGGINCTVSLSPYDDSISSAGGEGSVLVTTPDGCSYDTALGPSWISVTSGASGIGPRMLVYAVDPHSTTVPRSGSLTIGGQTFQITQEGLACSVTLNTAGLGSPYGSAGGTGTIGITTNGPNCSWNASSEVGWATATPPSGTGNATVFVNVTSNAGSATSRSGPLTINGQGVTIEQSGTTCEYRLQSPGGTVPAQGGTGSVGVVAPAVCGWSAATTTPAWLSISSSGTGGTADVQFVAQPNTGASPRMGSVTVAGLTYSVTQAGAPCAYTLGTTGVSVASTGVSDLFSFTAAATDCSPLAVSYANWITVGTAFAGEAGTVTYTVAPSPFGITRVGTVQVGDETFTISQTGGACGLSLNSYGALFSRLGGDGNVLGSPSALGCTPATGTTQPTIIMLGALTGPASNIFTQGYSVAPYDSLNSTVVRIGHITFGGQVFTVKQSSW